MIKFETLEDLVLHHYQLYYSDRFPGIKLQVECVPETYSYAFWMNTPPDSNGHTHYMQRSVPYETFAAMLPEHLVNLLDITFENLKDDLIDYLRKL